ncbi:hypothetical protein N9937_00575 [bacterium]|nr:hypothetical protein [bacterium]
MPTIQSTQHVDWTMTNGVDSSIDVTVSSMDMDHTIGVLDSYLYNNNNCSRTRCCGGMLTDTTYNVCRNSTVGNHGGTIDLCEWSTDVDVWHYPAETSNTSTDVDEVTITDITSTTYATAHIVGARQGGSDIQQGTMLGIRFKSGSTTAVEVCSGTGGNIGVNLYGIMIVRWPSDSTVQYVETSIGATDVSFNQAISAVALASTISFSGWGQLTSTDGEGHDNIMWRVRQTTTTNIAWDKAKASVTNSSGTAYTFTVTHADFVVEQVDASIGNTVSTENTDITAVSSLTEALAFTTGAHSMTLGKDTSTGTLGGQWNYRTEFLDTDTITVNQSTGYSASTRTGRVLILTTAAEPPAGGAAPRLVNGGLVDRGLVNSGLVA